MSNIDPDRLEDSDIPLPDEQFQGLPVFVCGGWVRDTIRGEQATDIDLMVAETTPSEMRERGFTEVDNSGNDTFAVFIDDLDREVAIAREEVSTGTGHDEFEVEPVPETVEASEAVSRDLERRDFSINAMAFDLRWEVLHDPHNGLSDLQSERIRHVSDAFRDDPLRILRGARFAARLDFDVAIETKRIMSEFVEDLEDLPGERVRMEASKNFREAKEPRKFFDILTEVGALPHSFPELAALRLVAAGPSEYHQEGTAWEHTLMVLEEMHDLMPNDELALWMALTHDLGKAETPSDELPSHHGHGERGIPIIEDMSDRLAFSNEQERACKEGARQHMRLKNVEEMRDATLFDTWKQVDNRTRLSRLMVADARGREPAGEFAFNELMDAFQRAQDAVAEVSARDLMDDGHDPEEDGEKFGQLLRQRRIEAMKDE